MVPTERAASRGKFLHLRHQVSAKPRDYPLADADATLAQLRAALGSTVTRFEPVGSVRRRLPFVGDLDVLVEVKYPIALNIARILRILKQHGKFVRGADRMMVFDRLFGCPVRTDVFLVHPPTSWFALLALRTGPAEDTQKLTAGLEAHGLKRPHAELRVADERRLYDMAGVAWRRPEERDA